MSKITVQSNTTPFRRRKVSKFSFHMGNIWYLELINFVISEKLFLKMNFALIFWLRQNALTPLPYILYNISYLFVVRLLIVKNNSINILDITKNIFIMCLRAFNVSFFTEMYCMSQKTIIYNHKNISKHIFLNFDYSKQYIFSLLLHEEYSILHIFNLKI